MTPPPAINRDRYGRPLVIPPGGGKPTAYTRCTTYIDCLEDKYNLQLWQQRMVATGLAARPDLLLAVSAHQGDKAELNRICADAREAAAASAAATTGTALHALTELVDRGQELPPLPPGAKASLDAYKAVMGPYKMRHIEQFLVLDTLKIGGTTDRIVKDGRDVKIADIKTGGIEFGALKIAMQLAVYARSWMYDIATGERSRHDASLTEGIVIHLPATDDPDKASCELYQVDLVAGWEAVQVAMRVRAKRQLKFTDLMHPIVAPTVNPFDLVPAIRACRSAESVRALWTEDWPDELNEIARQHIATLGGAA